jgi:hypothetical protein
MKGRSGVSNNLRINIWPYGEEARVYLRLPGWIGYTPKMLGAHLGIVQQSASRMLNGDPVGDKTIARALRLHPEAGFLDLFYVATDNERQNNVAFNAPTKAVVAYPATWQEAIEKDMQIEAADRVVPEPHIKVFNGTEYILAHAEDDTLYVSQVGLQDTVVQAIIRERFGLEPDEYYRDRLFTDERARRTIANRNREAS